MGKLQEIIEKVNSFIWGYPLIIFLLVAGIWFTVGLRAIQITKLNYAFKTLLIPDKKTSGEVSPWASLCIALSATIGTGNIVGVATAIALGGPGALFWLIVASLLGLAIRYAEGFLAIRYKDERLTGPFAYIRKGLKDKHKWLATAFAIFGLLAGTFGIGTLIQVNGVTDSANLLFKNTTKELVIFGKNTNLVTIGLSLLLTLVVALAITGGIKRISRICEIIVPIMAIAYVLICMAVLIIQYDEILNAIKTMVVMAFSKQSMLAGGVVVSVRTVIARGISRGLFSNEAGLGSGALASSTSSTNNPFKQGLGLMATTMITVIICLLTGLVIIVTQAFEQPETGIALTNLAFTKGLPVSSFVTACLLMCIIAIFAFTSIIGWHVYGIKCLEYLTNNSKLAKIIYRSIYIIMILIGPYLVIDLVWNLADICNALMVIPNLIALLILSPIVIKETRKFFKKK